MRLKNYIIVSVTLHLLLINAVALHYLSADFLRRMLSEAGRAAQVFNVDIVSDSGEAWQDSRPALPRRTVPAHRPDNRAPKTMFGDGVDSGEESGNFYPGAGKEPGSGDKGDSAQKGSEGIYSEAKSFLFDRDIIEKYARNDTESSKDLTFDVPEFHHRGYLRKLKDKIESIWEYPKSAARQGITGDLFIRFVIKKNGSLGDVNLVRTSGYKELDDAAIKALKDGQPYWPLPEDWEKDELSITGHFVYLLGSFHVM